MSLKRVYEIGELQEIAQGQINQKRLSEMGKCAKIQKFNFNKLRWLILDSFERFEGIGLIFTKLHTPYGLGTYKTCLVFSKKLKIMNLPDLKDVSKSLFPF